MLSRLSSAVQISVAWFCRPFRKIEPASSWYRLAFADRSGGGVACFNLVLLWMACLQYIPNLQDDFIMRSHTVELACSRTFLCSRTFFCKKVRKNRRRVFRTRILSVHRQRRLKCKIKKPSARTCKKLRKNRRGAFRSRILSAHRQRRLKYKMKKCLQEPFARFLNK